MLQEKTRLLKGWQYIFKESPFLFRMTIVSQELRNKEDEGYLELKLND